ncbi:OmpH family outer membrane protein [Psychroflexus sediminis]|uniref:Periplasmic chaperone for outer membrane proteins Skp n=1 Tax=Psychroflexus sediminis TaxID=470826 RepID=A0A1G7X2W0_9FLAO|nr:OmpH family outer membrane protein [Psychroflexus sediminis]SDG78524.1 periplasmic chaperone for outer membrane proteins Skp [Psychroflexus sediminis]
MRTLKTIVVALVLSFGLMSATNAQSNIAHINSQEFVRSLPSYQAAMTEVDQREKTYRKEIDDLLKEAQKTNERYQREAPTKTEEENQKRAMELQEMQQSIMEYRQTASEDLQKKQEELMRPVLEKARAVIQEVARGKGFDYVLDSSLGAGVLMADGYNLMADAKAAIGE